MMKFKFKNGIHLYPLVRYQIMHHLISSKYKLLTPHSSIKRAIILNTKYPFLTVLRNPFFSRGKYDIVTIGSSRHDTVIKDGKFFNSLYDYYNMLLPTQTVMLEDSYMWSYRYPRYFRNTYYRDLLVIISHLIGKLSISSHDISVIRKFLSHLQSHRYILEDSFLDELFKMLVYYAGFIKVYVKLHEKLFEKWKPKIIFINCASYGGPNATVTKRAKEMGIKVGEFQHGIVTKAHPAYNYGQELKNDEEFSKYLPDFFLVCGDFWRTQVRGPFKTVTIGNPHFWGNLSAKVSKERIDNEKKEYRSKKIVLIISQGTITNITVNLAKNLSKLLDNKYYIIFRLHPGEVGFKERYRELYSHKNIEISKSEDIYELISRSNYVVGVYSTTIFEAFSFGKPVFVLDHPLSRLNIPREIGIWFNTPQELAELIKNSDELKTRSNTNIEYFWNSHWKENYLNFLKNEVYLGDNQ